MIRTYCDRYPIAPSSNKSSLKRDAVPEPSQHHRKGRECTLVLEVTPHPERSRRGRNLVFKFRLVTKVEPEVSARRAVGQSTRPAADLIGKRALSSCQKSPC